jgi:hypothetical protein
MISTVPEACFLAGTAAINRCHYPCYGRAQRSGCSDMLGLVQCSNVLYARSKLPSVVLRGNTSRLPRASLPCTSSKGLAG